MVALVSHMSLNKAMCMLADDPRVLFIGQNVAYDGNVVFKDLENITINRRLEMPVAEEMQMGMSIGLSLMGYIPVSIYPRMDFLMLAMNQLVNHLDKLPQMSQGQYVPRVIIRTKVGATKPLHAGPQHTQDYTEALRRMLTSVNVVKVHREEDAVQTYRWALLAEYSTLVVEDIR